MEKEFIGDSILLAEIWGDILGLGLVDIIINIVPKSKNGWTDTFPNNAGKLKNK